MEIPTFVLVSLWFAVACFGVLVAVAAMALPSLVAWFGKSRRLVKVENHHLPPRSAVRQMDREALLIEGETIFRFDK